MKLRKLLKNLSVKQIKGSQEVEITGITSDSRQVAPGNLFVAKRSLSGDGTQFIHSAVRSGAAAILSDIYDPFLEGATQIVDSKVKDLEVQLLRGYWGDVDKEISLIGITGTNGKTTTSYLVRHFLESAGVATGLIGTIEILAGQQVLPSTHTTPDLASLFHLFFEMKKRNLKTCVMEVSSHALDQGRVRSLDYKVAIFTNLTPEHLDYHKTFEAYSEAKAKLFDGLSKGAYSVLWKEDAHSMKMIANSKAKPLFYGMTPDCDLYARNIETSFQKTAGEFVYKNQVYPFKTRLIGSVNVLNIMAAMLAGYCSGVSIEHMIQSLPAFQGVLGRFEKVDNVLGLHVMIDYAHTSDALYRVLQMLRPLCKGKLIVLFGCGGDRDRLKRPEMAKVAEEVADFAVVTTDNPRSEEPHKIIEEIVTGFTAKRYQIIRDRKEAISKTLQMVGPDDLLLIAGKGHEQVQIVGKGQDSF